MNQYTIVPWGCGETATRTIAVTTPPSMEDGRVRRSSRRKRFRICVGVSVRTA
jgi:hypothetical protein